MLFARSCFHESSACFLLEFESCTFSVPEYKVETNSLLVLDWVIPLQKYQEDDIEFVIFLTDVLSGEVYGMRALEPTAKNYEEKSGLLKGSLPFATPATDALVRFELRDGASTINPICKTGEYRGWKFFVCRRKLCPRKSGGRF